MSLLDFAFERDRGAYRDAHGAFVEYRKHAGQAHVDGRDARVGFAAEESLTASEKSLLVMASWQCTSRPMTVSNAVTAAGSCRWCAVLAFWYAAAA